MDAQITDAGLAPADGGGELDAGAMDASSTDADVPDSHLDDAGVIDAGIGEGGIDDAGSDAGRDATHLLAGGMVPPLATARVTLLDTAPAGFIVVAPGERSIVVFEGDDPSSSGPARLLVLDGDRVVRTIPLGMWINPREIRFTSDGADLAFVSGTELRAGPADGTGVFRVVSSSVRSVEIYHRALTWVEERTDGFVRLVEDASGAGVRHVLGPVGFESELVVRRSRMPTAVRMVAFGHAYSPRWVLTVDPVGELRELGTATNGSIAFAPHDARVVFGERTSTGGRHAMELDLVTGSVREVVSACACLALAISPDGTRLAYDVVGAETYPDVRVRTLADGTEVLIRRVARALTSRRWGDLLFSPDGATLLADSYLGTVLSGHYASIAPSTVAGMFRYLPSTNAIPEIAATSDYVALGDDVYALGTTTSHMVPEATGPSGLSYSRDAADPLLLAQAAVLSRSSAIYERDGATRIAVIPYPDANARWIDHRALTSVEYVRHSGDRTTTDLALVTDRGTTIGMVARGTISHAVAPHGPITALFFSGREGSVYLTRFE